MKIKCYQSCNGHVAIQFGDDWVHPWVFVNRTEMQQIEEGKFTLIYDNSVLEVHADILILHPSVRSHIYANAAEQEIPLKALVIYSSTSQLFKRIRQNIERLGPDKRFEMDTCSFRRHMHNFPEQLTYAQILKNESFMGKDALYFAVKHKVPFLLKLREILSRHLTKGFKIGNDYHNTPNFRFWGGGYNGGIIYHGAYDNYGYGSAPTFAVCLNPADGWSVHT